MSWWLAGLIGGVVAWLVDYVMWGKVFTKGMEGFATPPPAGQPVNMGPMLMKAAALSLAFGVVFAFIYARLMGALWVPGGGLLGGMEMAGILWLPICFETIGGGVWWDKARPLLKATCWSWLARMLAAGAVIGLLL